MENLEIDIAAALQALKRGKIILYPTDTIWGIGCDATNPEAIKKIYQLKKREEKKSMIILVAGENDIEKYVSHPSTKIIDFLSEQKKPTTAIFERAINLPKELINENGSVAIRIVQDKFCRNLISQLNKPIISTSANISGDITAKNFSEINDSIKNGVDYIVQHRQNEITAYEPSAIIKLNNANEIEKIR
jgi:L-threonylcarbamoyladenylate synthase